MTIEEFNKFNWRVGMRVQGRLNGFDINEGIESVDFWNHVIETLSANFHLDAIVSVLNPDGTVAWRKE